MKATGIVRKVDELGRVVLPKELRGVLDIKNRESLEIFTDGEQIILKKYVPGCIFCGETGNVKDFKGKKICSECIKNIR